jgi:antitoxin ParD1/3/4
MTSMNISLPDAMKSFIENQVASGGYGTASEYIRELIREDQKRKAQEKIEAALVQGLKSPSHRMTDADWERIDREVESRLEKRRQK